MPAQKAGSASLIKLLAYLTAGGALVFTAFFATPPAQADPHAVFYTVVGQQQLFFNVLAALDQADYVESQSARQQLFNQREGAAPNEGSQFGEDQDKILKQTQTSLSGVLTRGITLEGQDLWSTYLAYQAAKERQAQGNVDEGVRRYCDTTLSRIGCEEDEAPRAAGAYTYDGNDERNQQAITDGYLGALASDLNPNSEDQKIRQEKKKEANNEKKLVQGRAWSDAIALLRESARETDNIDALENVLQRQVPSVFKPSLDPKLYEGLTPDGQGGAKLAMTFGRDRGNTAYALTANGREVSAEEYAAVYAAKLLGLQGLSAGALQEARNGAAAVENMRDAREAPGGAVAPTKVRASETTHKGNKVVTWINETIKAPAYLVAAVGASAVQAVMDVESNPQHVPVEEQTTISDAAANAPESGGGNQAQGPALSQVAGISDSNRAPRVLHIQPDEKALTDSLHKEDTFKGPGVNPSSFHHAFGPEHLLTYIRGVTTGCGCQVGSAIAQYYDEIMANII